MVFKKKYHCGATTLRQGKEITPTFLELKNFNGKELMSMRNCLSQCNVSLKNARKSQSVLNDLTDSNFCLKRSGWKGGDVLLALH